MEAMDHSDVLEAASLGTELLSEVPETTMAENSDDKKLLDHLLELGNLDGSKRQLTVSSDFVQKLSSIWESFRQSVENRKILDVPNVFKELLRYTGFTIFDMDYEKFVDSSVKSQLLDIVLKTSESLRDYSKFQKLCKSLKPILISPWPLKSVPTLLETKLEDLTLSAIDPVWISEGWYLLEIRLEIMGRSKKMTMKELMIRLLHICVLQGKEWFRSSEDWKTYSLSTEVEEPFDPFRYSFNKYVNFLEIYFIFWLKYPELPHVDSIKDLPPGVMARVLKSLRVQTTKSWDSVSGRMVPLIWKSTPTSIASKLVNQLFEAALQRESEVVGVKELLEQFVELFRESYDENEVEDKMRTTVTHILFKRERIYTTNYIYALAEVILEKFGLTETSRIIYVDAYMRAIMIDLNEIEVLRAQVPIKTDILRSENIKLAKRLDVLANFFKEFPKASRDLRLTAFSLNPTTDGFHNLFPNYKPKAKSQPKAIEAASTSTLESNPNPSQSTSKETSNANNTAPESNTEISPALLESKVNGHKEKESEMSIEAVAVTLEGIEHVNEQTSNVNGVSEQASEEVLAVQRTEIVPMEVETPEESPPVFDEDEDNFLTAQEDLNLPEDLKDDFATILIKPRWGALGHFCRGEELRSLCYKLIDGGHDLLIKGPDLQFVVVDYEKYAHLPSKYDPNDDGIERGFFNPNKRKYVRRPPGTPARRKPNNNNNKKWTGPTGKARGRPKGWNRALSDQKKAAALKKRQNQNKPGTGRGRKSALEMRKIQQSVKVEEESSRIEERLKEVRQWMANSETLREYLQSRKITIAYAPHVKNKKTKMKENYTKAFLSKALPIPPELQGILTPFAQSGVIKVDKSKVKRFPPRRPATAYICHETPHKLRLEGAGGCSLEFRVERHSITKRFMELKNKSADERYKKSLAHRKTRCRPEVPKTTEKQWEKADEAKGDVLSTLYPLKAVKSTGVEITMNKKKLEVSPKLVNLARKYEDEKKKAREIRVDNEIKRIREEGGKGKSNAAIKRMKFLLTNQDLSGASEMGSFSFAFGEVFEAETEVKQVIAPRGPKRVQEEFKKTFMIKDSMDRVKHNLKLKTYDWDAVHKQEEVDLMVEKLLAARELKEGGDKVVFPDENNVVTLQNGVSVSLSKAQRTGKVFVPTDGVEMLGSGPQNIKRRVKKSRKFLESLESKIITMVKSENAEAQRRIDAGGSSIMPRPLPSPHKYGKTYSRRSSEGQSYYSHSQGDTDASESSSYSEGGRKKWEKLSEETFLNAKAAVLSGKTIIEVACQFGYKTNTLRKKLQKVGITAANAPVSPGKKKDDQAYFVSGEKCRKKGRSPATTEDDSEGAQHDERAKRLKGNGTSQRGSAIDGGDTSSQQSDGKGENSNGSNAKEPEETKSTTATISFPQMKMVSVLSAWSKVAGKPMGKKFLCEVSGKMIFEKADPDGEVKPVEECENTYPSWTQERKCETRPGDKVDTPEDDEFWLGVEKGLPNLKASTKTKKGRGMKSLKSKPTTAISSERVETEREVDPLLFIDLLEEKYSLEEVEELLKKPLISSEVLLGPKKPEPIPEPLPPRSRPTTTGRRNGLRLNGTTTSLINSEAKSISKRPARNSRRTTSNSNSRSSRGNSSGHSSSPEGVCIRLDGKECRVSIERLSDKHVMKLRKRNESSKAEIVPEVNVVSPPLISPATSNENSNDSFGMKRSDRIRSKPTRLDFSNGTINKVPVVDGNKSLVASPMSSPALSLKDAEEQDTAKAKVVPEVNGILKNRKGGARRRMYESDSSSGKSSKSASAAKKSRLEKENYLPEENGISEVVISKSSNEEEIMDDEKETKAEKSVDSIGNGRKRVLRRSESGAKTKKRAKKTRIGRERKSGLNSSSASVTESSESSGSDYKDSDYQPSSVDEDSDVESHLGFNLLRPLPPSSSSVPAMPNAKTPTNHFPIGPGIPTPVSFGIASAVPFLVAKFVPNVIRPIRMGTPVVVNQFVSTTVPIPRKVSPHLTTGQKVISKPPLVNKMSGPRSQIQRRMQQDPLALPIRRVHTEEPEVIDLSDDDEEGVPPPVSTKPKITSSQTQKKHTSQLHNHGHANLSRHQNHQKVMQKAPRRPISQGQLHINSKVNLKLNGLDYWEADDVQGPITMPEMITGDIGEETSCVNNESNSNIFLDQTEESSECPVESILLDSQNSTSEESTIEQRQIESVQEMQKEPEKEPSQQPVLEHSPVKIERRRSGSVGLGAEVSNPVVVESILPDMSSEDSNDTVDLDHHIELKKKAAEGVQNLLVCSADKEMGKDNVEEALEIDNCAISNGLGGEQLKEIAPENNVDNNTEDAVGECAEESIGWDMECNNPGEPIISDISEDTSSNRLNGLHSILNLNGVGINFGKTVGDTGSEVGSIGSSVASKCPTLFPERSPSSPVSTEGSSVGPPVLAKYGEN